MHRPGIVVFTEREAVCLGKIRVLGEKDTQIKDLSGREEQGKKEYYRNMLCKGFPFQP